MADTFQEMWRRLKLYSPTLPVPLCQDFIRKRYREMVDQTTWSFSFAEGQFIVRATIQGTASVTRFSNVINFTTGGLPGNNTAIVGRQVLFGGRAPIYTIIANPSATSFTIDQPYGESTNAAIACQIADIYFTSEKEDFERLVSFKDPRNNWQLRTNVHAEELNSIDPQRMSAGTPSVLAGLNYNTEYLAQLGSYVDCIGKTANSTPLPRFELWPRQGAEYLYPYLYKKRAPEFTTPDSRPLGAIRGDVIVEGALADVCRWPGTSSVPNPMANPVLGNVFESRYQKLVDELVNKDRSIVERSMTYVNTYMNLPFPPIGLGARFYQSHVSTMGVW